MQRRVAQCGVESDVAQVTTRRPGLDITTALATGAGEGALACGATRQPVERGLDTARAENVADARNNIYLLAAADAEWIGGISFDRRACAPGIRAGLIRCAVIRYFFFFPASSPAPGVAGPGPPAGICSILPRASARRDDSSSRLRAASWKGWRFSR